MNLSILIPTIPERKDKFSELLKEIYNQIDIYYLYQSVEVLFDNAKRGQITTGEKRNRLKNRAIGKYIWFVDDDDMIMPSALELINEASDTDCDVMAINGIMTTDGINEKQWYISLENPYKAEWVNGNEIYLRFPNHITPMKRENVKDIYFEHKNNFEDFNYANEIKTKNLLKTETKIDLPVYHYRYSTHNKLY